MTSSSKAFVQERICIFAGEQIDLTSDEQVKSMLRHRFNIHLPQRQRLVDALSAALSDHEIISLLLKYRSMA